MTTAKRSKVLILGTSEVEEELATSFRRLGYEVQVGTFAQGAPGAMTPDITVVGEGDRPGQAARAGGDHRLRAFPHGGGLPHDP